MQRSEKGARRDRAGEGGLNSGWTSVNCFTANKYGNKFSMLLCRFPDLFIVAFTISGEGYWCKPCLLALRFNPMSTPLVARAEFGCS